jgi:hypothetical protein
LRTSLIAPGYFARDIDRRQGPNLGFTAGILTLNRRIAVPPQQKNSLGYIDLFALFLLVQSGLAKGLNASASITEATNLTGGS